MWNLIPGVFIAILVIGSFVVDRIQKKRHAAQHVYFIRD